MRLSYKKAKELYRKLDEIETADEVLPVCPLCKEDPQVEIVCFCRTAIVGYSFAEALRKYLIHLETHQSNG